MKILNTLKFKGDLQIYYISRCYATRHGRGLFPTAVEGKPYKKIVDLTNVPNEFQESMRFGILDVDLLIEGINEDLKNLVFPAEINMFLTCFDQLDEEAKYVFNGKEKSVSKKQFLTEVSDILNKNIVNLSNVYVTTGETRKDVMKNAKR